ncbi:transposase [Cohnella sp. REN36]|uniref:transposase n=1 Tax=Cohnella sp. REN36 TaxID=2887347 RepID=UPI001D13ADD9|nr:transposase [Cohnella sp. REN36]MCC3373985.1 transposase [Cohnella sp. REN36]
MFCVPNVPAEDLDASETFCEQILFAAKWPNGFSCPRCNFSLYYPIRTRNHPLYECRACRHQTSLLAGTIMEGSRTPLRKWFQAIRWMSAGISARELSQRIQVTYKTAWLINHKLRHAMTEANERTLLTGTVHIQDAIYSGPFSHTSAYPHAKDQPVLAGAEVDANGQLNYVKIEQVSPTRLKRRYPIGELGEDFARRQVADSAQQLFIETRPCRRYFKPLSQMLRFAFRWLSITFIGIGPKHLQAYLTEFAFRFNHARQLTATLTQLCANTFTLTYPQLVRRSPDKGSAPFHATSRSMLSPASRLRLQAASGAI